MTNPSKKIDIQVPLHYKEYAPNFIVFMQRYYDWLHRLSGLEKSESEELRKTSDSTALDANKSLNPGAFSDALSDLILLEEIHEEFVTADDEFFMDKNDILVETHKIDDDIIDEWFSSFGVKRAGSYDTTKITDPVLMISLMKHINAIKGTEQSIQLFFNIFFNENVEVYYPKADIAVIDDNMIPDVSGVIRDDYYYNEYSYVIRVNNDINRYEELFQKVYMKNVHPAGFKVFLEKK